MNTQAHPLAGVVPAILERFNAGEELPDIIASIPDDDARVMARSLRILAEGARFAALTKRRRA